MKIARLKNYLLIIIIFYPIINATGKDPVKFGSSINYYRDLSDTYGGGGYLTGEFEICKSWYGANISFGHFQSQYTFMFKVPVQEINAILEIPVQEMSIMQICSISAFIRPFQNRWFSADILAGCCIDETKSFFLKGIDFSYNINEQKFSYLIKDYQLYKKSYIGYQIGLDLSFYFTSRIGLRLSSRMQGLSKGGSFFFVGGGLCFRL